MNLESQDEPALNDIPTNENELQSSQPTSSSNNILNQNLSGSFRESQSFGDRDSNNGEFGTSHTTIYAPVEQVSQPQTRWPNQSVAATQYQPLSNSRLGVAAIPNQNLSQFQNVPNADNGLNTNGDRRNPRTRTDTQRPPASSQQYFV